MLTERTILNGYSVLADKAIRVSYLNQILRGEVVISSLPFEELLIPGQDVKDRGAEIQAVCAAIWTPEVIAAYRTERKPI